MTTETPDHRPPRQRQPAQTGKGIDEAEEKKLPGVPSHLQAAVQQLIGDDQPQPSKTR